MKLKMLSVEYYFEAYTNCNILVTRTRVARFKRSKSGVFLELTFDNLCFFKTYFSSRRLRFKHTISYRSKR